MKITEGRVTANQYGQKDSSFFTFKLPLCWLHNPSDRFDSSTVLPLFFDIGDTTKETYDIKLAPYYF